MKPQQRQDRDALLERLRREIDSPRVIDAMQRVPREAFLPPALADRAYEDNPHPIGQGQTISQPFIVALMLAALDVRRSDQVLEVGAGSGYQAALLAELARSVVTTERVPSLADVARRNLERLGYDNVRVIHTAAGIGWPAEGPVRRHSRRCRRAHAAPRAMGPACRQGPHRLPRRAAGEAAVAQDSALRRRPLRQQPRRLPLRAAHRRGRVAGARRQQRMGAAPHRRRRPGPPLAPCLTSAS